MQPHKRTPYRENVAAFIRSIIGIEQETAFEKYRELIKGTEMTRMQEEYLRNLIRYVVRTETSAPSFSNLHHSTVSLRYLSKAITP